MILFLWISGCSLESKITEIASPSTSASVAGGIYIEDKNDGTGTKVELLTIYVGDSYDLFAVERNSGDFVGTISAAWSLTGTIGSLNILPGGTSAVFTASSIGTGSIRITVDGVSHQFNIQVVAYANPLIISNTKITSNVGFSYVEMDVDWGRKLAYLGSRKSGICVEVVDFSDETSPVLVKTIGSASLDVCLGVKLFDNNTKLAVSSTSDNKVSVWDLTSDPTDYASWSEIAQVGVSANGKRFAKIVEEGSGTFSLYVALRFGAKKLTLTTSPVSLTVANSWIGSCEYNDAAFLAGKYVTWAYCSPTPLEILTPTMVYDSSTANIGATPWGWAADNTADELKGVFGGVTSLVFTDSTGGTLNVVKKLAAPPSSTLRNINIVSSGSAQLAYMVYASRSVQLYDITNISSPVLLSEADLSAGTEGEGYAIMANSTLKRGIIATNRGDFVIFDTRAMTAATAQPADYP